MRSTTLGWLVVGLALGCSPSQSGTDAAMVIDAGTDAATRQDVGTDTGAPEDASVDAPPAMVTFEIDRLIRPDGSPAAGARVCIVGRPSDRCAMASGIGGVAIALESSTDHVLEVSLEGHRTFLYPVHAGTADFRREGDFAFFTVADDAAYYGPLVAGTGTLTLRAESSPVLAGNGEPGIVFSVTPRDPLDGGPSALAVHYATDSAAMLDPSLAETTISGLGGVNPVAPGAYVVEGHDTRTPHRCRLWFGGFETPTGDIAVDVEADRDVRLELRCW